jgi:hypothetical protein
VTQEVTLHGAVGTDWFVVVTNATQTVTEVNSGNDTAVATVPVTVTAAPLPDLVVASITPPPSGVYSGTSFPLSFVV